jgi:hypothetical protein
MEKGVDPYPGCFGNAEQLEPLAKDPQVDHVKILSKVSILNINVSPKLKCTNDIIIVAK